MQTLTQSYEVNSFLVNPQRKLGLYALLNLLQDASWAHGLRIGLGRDDDLVTKAVWVIGRQRLVMQAWPAWGESVEIETWLRPPARSTVNRDSAVRVGGQPCGVATTVLLLLDPLTRKAMPTAALGTGTPFWSDRRVPVDAEKIEPGSAMAELARFAVRNSDLDMNQHVNNTRYAQWILDSIPIDWHRQFTLQEYAINFLAETRLGDVIAIQKGPSEPAGERAATALFQGVRDADGKVVFTARLVVAAESGVFPL